MADFSAIEARAIAWLAGEQWRQQVFAEGKDIYCASASQMFGVPVEKHGVNGHLRQKGKIAELALGYGGSVGALKAMGAIEMGLQEEELKPLVDAWRTANPMIVKLWWEVDRAVTRAVSDKTAHGNTRHPLILSVWHAVHYASFRAAGWPTSSPRIGGESVRRLRHHLHGHKRREAMGASGKLRPEIRGEHRPGDQPATSCAMPCRRCGTARLWRMSTMR